jgi:hypothetical protein
LPENFEADAAAADDLARFGRRGFLPKRRRRKRVGRFQGVGSASLCALWKRMRRRRRRRILAAFAFPDAASAFACGFGVTRRMAGDGRRLAVALYEASA